MKRQPYAAPFRRPCYAKRAALLLTALLVAAASAQITLAAQPIGSARVLVDVNQLQAVKQQNIQAEAVPVVSNGRRGLQITTEAQASWPGVLFKPREGKWDLSAFDAVQVDLRNPQDVPVRVLLTVNNPGADGQRNCNTESVNVPARGKATLVVPFGMWHGDPGHPLDLSNIVSVMVMLDRPGRSHRFVVDGIRSVQFDRRELERLLADPFLKGLEPPFGRGVNLGNALEAPREGTWGVRLEAGYFDLIQKAGFDSVRIPVRWSAHAEEAAPYHIDPEFLARVDWAVGQAMDHRLRAVVNMHHYEEIMKEPDAHCERFLALWSQIAEHYRDYPAALSFELLNEPHGKLTSEKWNRLLAETIAVVRRTNPTRNIVVGPAGWNSVEKLDQLKLPEGDRHLIATVHYYSPFRFTHQGASWVGGQSQAWLGTKWTGTRAEKQVVERDLNTAMRWAVEHRRPMFLGEFGAYSKADMESRARWTRFVGQQALRRRMGFAYWEFCSGFGVYDSSRRQWVEPLKQALLDGSPQ